ncbi:hypothetical protein BDN67DRAFT_984990 [Paxillus ammoniavirescens]|nr:hypothetical protein BDN67DRAFT_984990 [Paxillus ammoniavirescens]
MACRERGSPWGMTKGRWGGVHAAGAVEEGLAHGRWQRGHGWTEGWEPWHRGWPRGAIEEGLAHGGQPMGNGWAEGWELWGKGWPSAGGLIGDGVAHGGQPGNMGRPRDGCRGAWVGSGWGGHRGRGSQWVTGGPRDGSCGVWAGPVEEGLLCTGGPMEVGQVTWVGRGMAAVGYGSAQGGGASGDRAAHGGQPMGNGFIACDMSTSGLAATSSSSFLEFCGGFEIQLHDPNAWTGGSGEDQTMMAGGDSAKMRKGEYVHP